jgi:hypothetical protein
MIINRKFIFAIVLLLGIFVRNSGQSREGMGLSKASTTDVKAVGDRVVSMGSPRQLASYTAAAGLSVT